MILPNITIIEKLAILSGVLKDDGFNDTKIKLELFSDCSGSVWADHSSPLQSSRPVQIFSFKDEEELEQLIIQEVGEQTIRKLYKEYDLDKKE